MPDVSDNATATLVPQESAVVPQSRPEKPVIPGRDALNRFAKGHSGNPGGVSRGLFSRHAMRRLRKQHANGEVNIDRILDAQIAEAVEKRSLSAATFLRDCADGPLDYQFPKDNAANSGPSQQVVVMVQRVTDEKL